MSQRITPAMNDIYKNIDKNRIPKHVAVIMDAAKKNGFQRVIGHEKGVNSVPVIVEASMNLTSLCLLSMVSTENWNRPEFEINAVMGLLYLH